MTAGASTPRTSTAFQLAFQSLQARRASARKALTFAVRVVATPQTPETPDMRHTTTQRTQPARCDVPGNFHDADAQTRATVR
eukprot:2835840-Rhodomonas_salina.1